jgi:metallophosphoesterase superfamily enzyme
LFRQRCLKSNAGPKQRQRARSAQFRQARVFLEALLQPQIVVPGNHDVPLHDVVSRTEGPAPESQVAGFYFPSEKGMTKKD